MRLAKKPKAAFAILVSAGCFVGFTATAQAAVPKGPNARPNYGVLHSPATASRAYQGEDKYRKLAEFYKDSDPKRAEFYKDLDRKVAEINKRMSPEERKIFGFSTELSSDADAILGGAPSEHAAVVVEEVEQGDKWTQDQLAGATIALLGMIGLVCFAAQPQLLAVAKKLKCRLA